ncbi:AI-2E family transporter [Desulfatitalea alkaliphila]|uniref:AI-2E family transporter n=1 Tax=Desulfatitalea alkaliphila TaxID=2929485 RepID=A0AA41UMX8_9BACT|nr:AI-2E family transporter [Desulfatitalea alkaliphila]MCJ8499003.1 AI-2E family transporter [Desulfatitalea alkaliphila]
MSGFHFQDTLLRRIVLTLGLLAVVIAGFHTFNLLREWLAILLRALSPFLAALLLAYLLAPIVSVLQRRLGMWRFLGAFVLYALIALLFLGMVAYLLPVILIQIKDLFETLQDNIPAVLAWLSERKFPGVDESTVAFVKQRLNEVQFDYAGAVDPFLEALKSVASGGILAAGQLTSGLLAGFRWMADVILFFVFVIVINFYLILDWHRIRPFLQGLVPARWRERTFETIDRIDVTVGGFLRGQLIVAAIVGSVFAVGLFLIGFIGFGALQRYAILIGTLAGIGGFIPYLGPSIGLTPAVLIVLLSGGETWSTRIAALAAVVSLFATIQAVEGWLLQPKIVGKGAGLHPLVVLFALVVGSQFGIGGLIIAVPAAGVAKVLLLEYVWEPYRQKEKAGQKSQ